MNVYLGLGAMLFAGTASAQESEEPAVAPAVDVNLLDTEEAAEEVTPEAPEATVEEAPPAPPAPQIAVEVALQNGMTLQGTVSQSDILTWSLGEPLQFTPQGGTSTLLPGDKILSIGQPGQAVPAVANAPQEQAPVSDYTSPGGFTHPNPAASRYLYAPSSIPLKKGQGYVSQKYGIFSSAAYAPHDNFTVLFGTLTVFPPAMTIFGGKAGFQVAENVHVSAGGEVFIFPIDGLILASIGFGAITLGDEDQHLTVASGYMNGEIFNNQAGVPIMVGAQKRLNNGVALITENWAVFDADDLTGGQASQAMQLFIGSAAVRLLGRRSGTYDGQRRTRTTEGFPRTTWDIGLLLFSFRNTVGIYNPATGQEEVSEFVSWETFGPFPWVDWTWHFGPSGM